MLVTMRVTLGILPSDLLFFFVFFFSLCSSVGPGGSSHVVLVISFHLAAYCSTIALLGSLFSSILCRVMLLIVLGE